MTEPPIVVRDLVKDFGRHRALDHVDLTVPHGSVYGFIGANGAGKTTTIRILLGLAAATSGRVTVLGQSQGILPTKPLSKVAYLPDVPAIYPWMTPTDALVTMARFSGVSEDVALERASDLLSLAGLERAHGLVGQFSRGMKQRLGIAASLVGAPQLLILDEPTSALDPLGRRDVMAMVSDLRGRTTVLFSSHLLADVESVCTHVGMIHNGRMIAEGSLEEVLALSVAPPSYTVTVGDADVDRLRIALDHAGLGGISVTEDRGSLQQVYENIAAGVRE